LARKVIATVTCLYYTDTEQMRACSKINQGRCAWHAVVKLSKMSATNLELLKNFT